MVLQKDLKEFVALLNAHKVDYLIVGGHAAAFHGYPRFTGDIDFFVRPTVANANRVLTVLADFGFGSAGITVDTLTGSGKVIQLGQPPNRIDLMSSISGVDFDSAWKDRVESQLDGFPVAFIGRDSLLKNKRSTGKTKDRDDVEEPGR